MFKYSTVVKNIVVDKGITRGNKALCMSMNYFEVPKIKGSLRVVFMKPS